MSEEGGEESTGCEDLQRGQGGVRLRRASGFSYRKSHLESWANLMKADLEGKVGDSSQGTEEWEERKGRGGWFFTEGRL